MGEKTNTAAGVKIIQPLFDPVRLLYSAPAAKTEAEAKRLEAARVKWSPFESGTRTPRAAAMSANIRAMKKELDEAKRQVAIEVKSAIAAIKNAREAYHVAENGVEQAAETLRMERVRRLEGRSTTNDLLDAEAQLRERRTVRGSSSVFTKNGKTKRASVRSASREGVSMGGTNHDLTAWETPYGVTTNGRSVAHPFLRKMARRSAHPFVVRPVRAFPWVERTTTSLRGKRLTASLQTGAP